MINSQKVAGSVLRPLRPLRPLGFVLVHSGMKPFKAIASCKTYVAHIIHIILTVTTKGPEPACGLGLPSCWSPHTQVVFWFF